MYEKLRRLRKEKGISAEEMIETLKLKTLAAYYKKEIGNVKFSLVEAKLVSEKIGMPIEQIFFENELS